jgi:hypothetical protein
MTFHPGDIDEGPTGALANEPHTTPRRPRPGTHGTIHLPEFDHLHGRAGRSVMGSDDPDYTRVELDEPIRRPGSRVLPAETHVRVPWANFIADEDAPTELPAALTLEIDERSRWTAAWAKAFDVMPPTVILIGSLLCLAVGAASGALIAPAPRECTVMAHTADKQLIAYENLAISTRLAVSRGMSEYDQHEADINAAYEELDDLRPVYREAKAACLGGTK